jgi:hypothetical protein
VVPADVADDPVEHRIVEHECGALLVDVLISVRIAWNTRSSPEPKYFSPNFASVLWDRTVRSWAMKWTKCVPLRFATLSHSISVMMEVPVLRSLERDLRLPPMDDGINGINGINGIRVAPRFISAIGIDSWAAASNECWQEVRSDNEVLEDVLFATGKFGQITVVP